MLHRQMKLERCRHGTRCLTLEPLDDRALRDGVAHGRHRHGLSGGCRRQTARTNLVSTPSSPSNTQQQSSYQRRRPGRPRAAAGSCTQQQPRQYSQPTHRSYHRHPRTSCRYQPRSAAPRRRALVWRRPDGSAPPSRLAQPATTTHHQNHVLTVRMRRQRPLRPRKAAQTSREPRTAVLATRWAARRPARARTERPTAWKLMALARLGE
jgi:hypothetical protein